MSQQREVGILTSTLKAQLKTTDERHGFVVRIQALEKLLHEQRNEDYAHLTRQIKLHRKYAKAEKKLLQQIEILQTQLQDNQETIGKLEGERISHQQTISRLGRIFTCFGPHVPPGIEIDDGMSLVTISEDDSSESRVHMTKNHLMMIIELLEDERHGFMTEIHSLGATIHELKQEREARELKISVLEDHFELMEKQLKVMDATAKDRP